MKTDLCSTIDLLSLSEKLRKLFRSLSLHNNNSTLKSLQKLFKREYKISILLALKRKSCFSQSWSKERDFCESDSIGDDKQGNHLTI